MSTSGHHQRAGMWSGRSSPGRPDGSGWFKWDIVLVRWERPGIGHTRHRIGSPVLKKAFKHEKGGCVREDQYDRLAIMIFLPIWHPISLFEYLSPLSVFVKICRATKWCHFSIYDAMTYKYASERWRFCILKRVWNAVWRKIDHRNSSSNRHQGKRGCRGSGSLRS
jgi:hypothetical protein